MDRTDEMEIEPVGALLTKFNIPAIIGLLIASLYNVVDRVFIGQATGVAGIAAVTAAWPIMICSFTFSVLFQSGTKTIVSVALGKKEREKAGEYLATAIIAVFSFTTISSLVLFASSEPVFRLFGTSESTMIQAKSYIRWILLCSPVQGIALVLTAVLSAEGRQKTCLFLQVLGTIINAALAPLFIFAFRWGVNGAGMAVAISQTIGLIATIIVFIDKKTTISPKLVFSFHSVPLVLELLRVGFPMAVMQIMMCVTFAVANISVRPYGGELGLAVIGVVVTIVQFVGFPITGIVNGAQPLWGYNYGANKWIRISRISILTIAWTLGLAIISEACLESTPIIFVHLFSTDVSLLNLGSRSLRIFAITFFCLPLELVPAFYFQATGRSGPASITLLVRSLSFIIGMMILPLYLGYDGVLWAEPLSDIFTTILSLIYDCRMLSEIRTKMNLELLSL